MTIANQQCDYPHQQFHFTIQQSTGETKTLVQHADILLVMNIRILVMISNASSFYQLYIETTCFVRLHVIHKQTFPPTTIEYNLIYHCLPPVDIKVKSLN